MKATLFLTIVLTSMALAAPPTQHSIQTALVPKVYRDGDVIEITDVMATSSDLEQGDSVTVRGRVRLDSRKSADLYLLVTQTEGDGLEENDPAQSTRVATGLTTFELKTTIKHKGMLHVTLYDVTTGKPFGGTYFGTAEQMKRIRDWSV